MPTAPDADPDLKGSPDSFVVLFPVPWEGDRSDEIDESHRTRWSEELTVSMEASDQEEFDALGRLSGPDDHTGQLAVEPPIDELVEAVGTSKEAFSPSEVALLEEQEAVWRLTVEPDDDEKLEGALWTAKLMSTFVEAGAAGVFVPAIAQLHPPSFIQSQTMSLGHIQPIVNLFVGAWDDDDWMVTRGLTSFGLPELETPVDSGLNAAYFRLMDTASNMINRREAFPPGGNLDIGRDSFDVEEGRQGPEDEQVPVSGAFGVLTLRPT